MTEKSHILEELYEVLLQRKHAVGEKSYVASLYEKGTEKIAEKIFEEAQEFIDEAHLLDNAPEDPMTRRNMTEEATDLFFHVLIMCAQHEIAPKDIFAVFERRFGISGHTEKSSRAQSS